MLQRLVDALAPLGRNYLVVHDDMSDSRGIDVAFIYDGDQILTENSVKIVQLPEMTKSGHYPVPIRRGRPS